MSVVAEHVTATSRFLFPVGATAVVAFAEAVRDRRSVRIPLTADDLAEGGLTPPPTFLVSAASVDPDTHLRPERHGRPVQGGPLHAGYRLHDRRYPRIGETLEVESRAGGGWTRRSRDGTELRLSERHWRYRDAVGATVASVVWLDVHTTRRAATLDEHGVLPPMEAPNLNDVSACTGPLQVGSQWSAVVVDSLDLVDLVRYSGAAGDLVPVHYSAAAAQRYGAAGVFGHGMLSLGLGCSRLTKVFDAGAVTAVDSRFRNPTLLGDRLMAIARIVRQLDSSRVYCLPRHFGPQPPLPRRWPSRRSARPWSSDRPGSTSRSWA